MKAQTLEIKIFGIVQAVGFRPTAFRHATSCHIRGYVCNKGAYVEIIAQGKPTDLNRFLQLIEKEPPERAIILKIAVSTLDDYSQSFDEFSIAESQQEMGNIFASPDIAICEECKGELYDKTNRRYLHPFINCTCCGPRLTILDDMPYDRPSTSMGEFALCPECGAEYANPSDRRYDAQPVCCPNCGPEVYLLSAAKKAQGEVGSAAIMKARQTIASGGIVAIKGIGGYHLCCDATSESAVARLRASKLRPTKPFAVMMSSIEVAQEYCHISESERSLLMGHQKPIALLKKRCTNNGTDAMCALPPLANSIAPNNNKLGVMLPYAPIQLLLFDYPDSLDEPAVATTGAVDASRTTTFPRALVMTSGNASGAPICRTEEDATEELAQLADYILSNNRDIRLRADDSVVDFYKNGAYMIRRSRGFAPLPFVVDAADDRCVLAIGGELKNSFCIRKGKLAYVSPYLGDVADVRTASALKQSIERMCRLLMAEPEAVVCDLHPGYATTQIAKAYADEKCIPLTCVQHHYAHVLACMAENNCSADERVIGVSFDGTGYGSDGTIWGGEFLIADYSGFSRATHITPFTQVGGDAAAKEGYRIALSLIHDLCEKGKISLEECKKNASPDEAYISIIDKLKLCESQAASLHLAALKANLNCVKSTSVGRLFDATAAVLGICRSSSHEGEAAMALQYAAECYVAECYAAECSGEKSGVPEDILTTEDIFATILNDALSGESPSHLAYKFHSLLAAYIASTCKELCQKTGITKVALTGGVFQNTLLLSLTEEKLAEANLTTLRHHLCPPNDGGICLGQAVVR